MEIASAQGRLFPVKRSSHNIAVWAALGTMLVALLGLGASVVSSYVAQASMQEARAAAQDAFENEAHRWHEVVRSKLDRNEERDAERQVQIAELRTTVEHLSEEIAHMREEQARVHGVRRLN